MKEAVVLVGLQGAGKSTYFAAHYAGTHELVSRDLQGSRERTVFLAAIAAGRPLVVDNTNATRASRAGYLRDLKAAGYRVTAVFFDVPVRTAIGRNNHRSDKKPVPVPAILRTAKGLERPELAEGFDEVREAGLEL